MAREIVLRATSNVLSRGLVRNLILTSVAFSGQLCVAGAACVMAKWQGETLDYALAYGHSHVMELQEAAQKVLHDKGYGRYRANVDVTHPQALTDLPHAFVVVIKSQFTTVRGKSRTSYGCGFAAASQQQALWAALRDMQAHSWGWKPDRDGYEIVEQLRY